MIYSLVVENKRRTQKKKKKKKNEMQKTKGGFIHILAHTLNNTVTGTIRNKIISKCNFLFLLYLYCRIDEFFFCYLAVPRQIFGHSQGGSCTNPMLITVFYLCRPEGHWEPCNEVGSLSPAKHLAGFEPRIFRF